MERFDPRQTVDPDAIAARLAPWLDDLEARIDPSDEDRLLAAWRAFADGRSDQAPFRPRRARPSPQRCAWPDISLDQALSDPALMVLQQLRGASDLLADVLEMLWGSACFTAFIDDGDRVHALLGLIADTYLAVLADWDAVVPDRLPGYCPHWASSTAATSCCATTRR
jgi:hypothetical protein